MEQREKQKLKHLIVVWHGIPEQDGDCLQPRGVADITRLGTHLKSVVAGSCLILTSPTHRTTCSSWLLAAELFGQVSEIAPSDVEECLDCSAEGGFPAIQALIMRYADHYDTIVLVTHSTVIWEFPNYYRREVLHLLPERRYRTVSGDALGIDCFTGEIVHYAPSRHRI